MSEAVTTPINTLAVPGPLTSTPNFFLPESIDVPRFDFVDGPEADPIHKRMRNHKWYGKRIQLRSIYGKTAQPVHIEVTHPRGNDTKWLGVPRLSPAETLLMQQHGFDLAIPGESFVDIPDGFEVDLGTEAGLYLWEWVQYAPQIVEVNDHFDPEKPHEGADKELYVIVPSQEIEKRAMAFTTRTDAANWIRTLSPMKWYDVARVIGGGVDNGTQLDVFNYLCDVAEKNPAKLMAVKNDNEFDQKLLIKRLLDAGILAQVDNSFRYNNVFLGTDEPQVLHYMKQAENATIVTYMKSALGIATAMGNVQVSSDYARYADEVAPVIAAQAAAPSAVLNQQRPASPAYAPPVPTNAELTNQPNNEDLGDDYQDDDEPAEANTSATVVPPALPPTVATGTGPRPPRKGVPNS